MVVTFAVKWSISGTIRISNTNEAFGNTLIIIIANSVCKHFSHMELSHFSFSYVTSLFANFL